MYVIALMHCVADAGIVGMGGENKPEYENVIMLLNIPSVLDKDSLKEIISPFGEVINNFIVDLPAFMCMCVYVCRYVRLISFLIRKVTPSQ